LKRRENILRFSGREPKALTPANSGPQANESATSLSFRSHAPAPGRAKMSDEKTFQDSRDPNRIDIDDVGELRYWSQSLRTTPDELRLAVAAVGPFVEKVCEYISRT
jgi:Protein of unknown function (DUF3606)